ncbi:hypothetical protein POM88_008884 [Heracleum sosnowskyi]|uniref:Uncharacterized protein n=1 Tax=Heracleum sosnowskyi TaxID=360622 RepID=A0AAD8J8A8_9APIA|nr:hypothetical protein POM88_008884 [Heracleum sosnowskyi]
MKLSCQTASELEEPFLGTKQYPLEVVDEKEIAVDRESKPDAEDGNDSVKNGSSSFTYSDTGSTAAENVPVDVLVAAKVSLSTKFCEDEVTVMSREKHSSTEELLEALDYQREHKQLKYSPTMMN